MFLNSLPFVVLLLTPCEGCHQPQLPGGTMLHPSGHATVISEFTDGIARYMNVRWMLEPPIGPETLCADPEETQRVLVEFANTIRLERAAARPGNIFTPAVARFFRRHVGAALRADGYHVRTDLEDAETGIPIDLPTVEVNGALPWGVGDLLWPSLLAKLPALPVELEYRIVGRDLVLLDVSINLVVDILENVDGR